MKEQGENYEMDPRLRDYFAELLMLSNDQIEGIEGIADRIVQRLPVPVLTS
jgi:hypothetical protein